MLPKSMFTSQSKCAPFYVRQHMSRITSMFSFAFPVPKQRTSISHSRHLILKRRLVNQRTRFRLERASRRSSSTTRAMFNVFFDICYVKNGVVTSRGVETMVAILNKAKVEVTVGELQPNVASLHPTGERTRLVADNVPDLLQTWNSYLQSFLKDTTFLHTDRL